ncbi:chemotaxis protein [Alteromonas halophila]|uniref:HBM domain-containing protein n=1 Tax=Alteromonas halophila TaxID=516698 RepID=A0A918N123_9ALTE|nr:chemotaxis protein [Alteromonas halophila]GGW92374.1 hypothetical protein GCM10007391_28420 [Alteromonas halophila]
MTLDSIKARLALIICICVLGIGMMVVSQHYYSGRLISINQQQELLLRLGQDLLQMRRHEKDFLLRHQPRYLELFNQRASLFSDRLKQLSPLFEHYDLPVGQAGELAQSLQTYQQLFQRVVALQTQIGLTTRQGLQGQLSECEAQLLRTDTFNYGQRARVQLDEARLHIRHFLLSRDTFYAKEANTRISQLRTSLPSAREIRQFQQTFETLVDGYKQLGLTHNDGLRGQFRRQAHDVESQLQRIDAALQPIIDAQQQDVRHYSISIAIFTAIALVILLLKSVATFQKAFGNFVMFFYRCKRQYHKIDPRCLGFAEFKSLAQIANEMVESRRETERQLAMARAQLRSENTRE